MNPKIIGDDPVIDARAQPRTEQISLRGGEAVSQQCPKLANRAVRPRRLERDLPSNQVAQLAEKANLHSISTLRRPALLIGTLERMIHINARTGRASQAPVQEGVPMQIETNRDYHIRRARVELDLAYRAEARRAMEAHLRLSALHMARLREAAAQAAH